MKTIFSGVFFMCIFSAFSQTSDTVNVQVITNCTGQSEITGQELNVVFEENSNKCDPEIGYLSIEDLLHHFHQSLDATGINKSRFERSLIKSSKTDIVKREYYTFQGTIAEVEKIEKIVENQQLSIENISPTYEDYTLEDQDDSAICAVKKAIERAGLIAKNMGYKNCILVSVNDDTSGFLSAWSMGMYEFSSLSYGGAGAHSYSIECNFEMY